MIYLLLEILKTQYGVKIPAVFTYTSTRMILAAITSLILSIFLGPYFIRKLYELKIGQTIRTDECPLLGDLHAKKKDTPTMGGILILAAMLVSMLLWMDLRSVFTLILFVTTMSLGLIGGYDDFLKLKYKNTKGLSARKKMLFQLAISGVIALYLLSPAVAEHVKIGKWFAPPVIKEQRAAADTALATVPLHEFASRLYIPMFKEPLVVFGGAMAVLIGLLIMCVITGSSNAANLTDGLDGLLAGCLIMVACCLAFIGFVSNNIDLAGYLNIAYIEGSGEIAIYLCAMVGACLGFLWYNAHPAQVFMGDIGSLALGGIIGVSAVLLKREILLAVIGGIFVAEAMSVILQVASYKLRDKKRIFLCAPLHHHYEYKGWHETKVVTRFWIIGLLLAIVGIATLKFQ
jgi:phospho-N-acetylmuramoyl-pentapeptide-transferase